MKKPYPLLLLLFFFACLLVSSENIDEESRVSDIPYFLVRSNGNESFAMVIEGFPLKGTTAEVSIAGVIAEVTVTQTYFNNGTVPLEAQYIFPASTHAAVHHMEMNITSIDGRWRVITAVLKEKEEAREIYQQAKEGGHIAGLLTQIRPNMFSIEVANILPKDQIQVTLVYSELLLPISQVYSFVYPTVVGPRYTGEGTPEQNANIPNAYYSMDGVSAETRPKFNITIQIIYPTGMKLNYITCKTHSTIMNYNALDVNITLNRTVEGIGRGGNRDFILDYKFSGETIQSGLLLYRPEVTVNSTNSTENFFLMMLQPPQDQVNDTAIYLPREFVFILDISGSMWGFPLDTAFQLMRTLIKNLRVGVDLFNIVVFETSVSSWRSESVYVSSEEIDEAFSYVKRQTQSWGGGTNIVSALNYVFDSLSQHDNASRINVVITDGYVSAETTVFELIRSKMGQANLFAFGIGSSVNRYLIEGMAHSGQGLPLIVTDQRDINSSVTRFMNYVGKPILRKIKIQWPMEVYDVEPKEIGDVMIDRPIQVMGKFIARINFNMQAPNQIVDGDVTVIGSYGIQNKRYETKISLTNTAEQSKLESLKYLWARMKLVQLSYESAIDKKKEIVQLGLKYNLLTEYTSFVAVEEEAQVLNGTVSIKVTQPLVLPQGVTPEMANYNGAYSGSNSMIQSSALHWLLKNLCQMFVMLAKF